MSDSVGRVSEQASRAPGSVPYVIYVEADAPDEAAMRLYESLGTREDGFHFDIIP